MKCPHCGHVFDPEPSLFGRDLKRMSRREQPITSQIAALRAYHSQSETRRAVGETLLQYGAMTDRELHSRCCERYGERAESSYRKRRSEMTDDGLVFDTGQTRVEDGERRVCWSLTHLGRTIFGATQPKP